MANGRKGFLARCARGATRYLVRRFGNPFINGVGGAALRDGAEGAGSAMAASRFDIGNFRAALFGRYSDGGAARFAERIHALGVTDEQLARLARNLRRSAVSMLVAAGGFLALAAFQIATASLGRQLLFGIATAFAAFFFLASSARHDFGCWQIKSRRFGGFQEYLLGICTKSPKPGAMRKK